MQDRVEAFLNKRWKKVGAELDKLPFPAKHCLDQRTFSYNLGQHDLIMELFSTLGIQNPNTKKPNKERDSG